MRPLVLLADRVERWALWRELVHAVRDGVVWGWLVCLVAAAVVWVARDMPSPITAAGAAAAIPVGAGLAAWRSWRRMATRTTDEDACRQAARTSWRRWLTGYALVAVVLPAGWTAYARDDLTPVAAVVAALAVLAVVTIPVRARARLLARLRVGAAAVAGGEDVRVGRALWSGWTGLRLDRVVVAYPADWAAHRDVKREELVTRVVYDLCGPPPETPAEAIRRPDYTTAFDHVDARLMVERVPSLPRRLAACDWGPRDGIVLGQTIADQADAVVDRVPIAVYKPHNHALIVGATQHGKSSGVRAWAVDGLTHGVFAGGVWCVDGKGSGSMAPLIGRRGVHAVAHSPDEWRHVITELVAPEVARRYEETLAWRSGSGTTGRRPHHPLSLLILDELQQVLLVCPDLVDTINTLARQALEARVIMWVLTQRPDAADAVPGAVRDQLIDRVTFGPLGAAGAKMSFDVAADWHKALGVAPIPGRALTWMGGHWRPIQAPWLPIPADDPTVDPLYPAKDAGSLQEAPQAPQPPKPKATPTPVPKKRRTARRERQKPSGADPVDQIERLKREFDESESSAPAYDPGNPYKRRRRGRRRD